MDFWPQRSGPSQLALESSDVTEVGLFAQVVFSERSFAMRSLRYLNSVLTLIALLLTLNLITMWSVSPSSDVLSFDSNAHAQGTISAGQQRQDMTDQLKQVNLNINQINENLTNGNVRVQIQAIPD